jgi:hypothetical protein
MWRTRLACFISVVLTAGASAPCTAAVDKAAYARCTTTASSGKADVDEAIAACVTSAQEDVPGAMYVLGALLLKKADRHAEALSWLEKAAKAGHPAAALALAKLYLDSEDKAVIEHGRALLRTAACSGYPEAVKLAQAKSLSLAMMNCRSGVYSNFVGTWSGTLKSVKSGEEGGSELRVVIDESGAHVFFRLNNSWAEAKPGKFSLTSKDGTAVISTLDTGWDFDGEWIETWEIHLLRLDTSEAFVNLTRTVNNPDMPPTMAWRTFTTVSEGIFKRD